MVFLGNIWLTEVPRSHSLFAMRPRKLNQVQVQEVCCRYKDGEDSVSLAAFFDVSPTTIRKWLKMEGIARRSQKQRTDNRIPEKRAVHAKRLLDEGKTLVQIADQTGIPRGSLPFLFSDRFGVAKRLSTKRHKLSAEQKAELCSLYEEGQDYRSLGIKFGIAPTTVGQILVASGKQPRIGWAKYRTTRWSDKKGRSFIFKSTWEMAFAKYLDEHGATWDYETLRFPLKICRRYTPDFVVYEDSGRWLAEIHGWLDERTEQKLLEFRATYPEERLEILGPQEMVALGLIESDFSKHPMAAKVSNFRDHFGNTDRAQI